MKKKVLIISQYFKPDMAGTGRVMEELSEEFNASGYEVTVLAGRTRYFLNTEYKAYKNKFPVKRIWHPFFNKDNVVGRILNMFSFPIMAGLHVVLIFRHTDVVLVSNPPTIVFLAGVIRVVFRKNVFFILQDIYPDLVVHLGYLKDTSLLARLMESLQRTFLPRLDIIVLTQSMRTYLIARYNLNPETVTVIENWADPHKIFPASKDNPWSRVSGYINDFVVLYAGNIGLVYGFEAVIEAAKKLQEVKNITFLIVGEGAHKPLVEAKIKEENLTNIELISYVPEEDYNKLLATADCHIVIQNPGMEKYNFPGKVYSYLASGRPIIAITEKKSELAHLIQDAQAGIVALNGDGVVNAIKTLLGNKNQREYYGENARNYLQKHFTRQAKTRQFVNLLGDNKVYDINYILKKDSIIQ